LAITNVDLIRAMICISPDGEIREIIGEMIGRFSIRISVHCRWPSGNGEKSQRRCGVNLIGVVESVVAFESSVTRLRADLTNRPIGGVAGEILL